MKTFIEELEENNIETVECSCKKSKLYIDHSSNTACCGITGIVYLKDAILGKGDAVCIHCKNTYYKEKV